MTASLEMHDLPTRPHNLENLCENARDVCRFDFHAEELAEVDDVEVFAVDADFDVGVVDVLREETGFAQFGVVTFLQHDVFGGDFADHAERIAAVNASRNEVDLLRMRPRLALSMEMLLRGGKTIIVVS